PAVRHPPPRQDDQGQVIPAASPGVPLFAVTAPNAVDQLVLRRHGRRHNLGGRQTICGEPTQRVGRALTSPRLKPGVSRALSDEATKPNTRTLLLSQRALL